MNINESELCKLKKYVTMLAFVKKTLGPHATPQEIAEKIKSTHPGVVDGVLKENCFANGCAGEVGLDLEALTVFYAAIAGNRCNTYDVSAEKASIDLLQLHS